MSGEPPKPVVQACDYCGENVRVNAVSPSECFCSAECCEKFYEERDHDRDRLGR